MLAQVQMLLEIKKKFYNKIIINLRSNLLLGDDGETVHPVFVIEERFEHLNRFEHHKMFQI